MKLFVTISALLFLLSGLVTAEEIRIRVAVETANIRLKPDFESLVIGQAPLGATFESDQKIREWYRIKLPPDEDGVVLNGFIHESIVEVLPPKEEEPKLAEKKPKVEIPAVIEAEKKPEVPQEKKALPKPKERKPEPRLPREKAGPPSKIEISLKTGGLLSLGSMNVEDVPSDLYTGRWSPWFGQGYTDFTWPGETPVSMDSVIGAPVLRQGAGLFTGAEVGWNFHPRFQVYAAFCAYFSGLKFNGDAWDTVEAVISDSVDVITSNGREVMYNNNSENSGGKTYLISVGINFYLLTDGPVIPYLLVGAGMVLNSGTPSISYSLEQTYSGTSAAYSLDVTYDKKIAFAPVFGLGAKKYLGSFFGVKAELKGILAPLYADQNVKTTFTRETSSWTPYTDYEGTSAVQKGSRIILDLGVGFFVTF